MKSLYILFIAIVLAVSSKQINAQSLSIGTDTLVWEVSQVHDEPHDSTMTYTAQFVSYGDSKIVWIQHDDYTNEFTINSVSGNWDDPSTQGSIEFSITLDNKPGTITISRSGTVVQISTSLMDNGQDRLPYIFNVTTVNKKL